MTTRSTNLRIKLTTAAINKYLVPPIDSNAPTMVYDSELSGFGVYRTSERAGSYFVHYRVHKKQKKKVIARVNEMNVADARDEAAKIKLAARQGNDLVAERIVLNEQDKTLGAAYEEYLQMLKRKKRSAKTLSGYDTNWRISLSAHANSPLRLISKSDIRKWHTQWAVRGHTSANQTVTLFRAIYNQALRTMDGLPPNPCVAVDFFPEEKVRKKLEWEDAPAWLAKVDELENPIRRCFWRFLLHSGLRRSDACSVRWDEIDSNCIHRPSPKGGADHAFDLPLSPQLEVILSELRKLHSVLFPNSPYIFPANSSCGYITAPREKSFLDVTPHVLRRKFATACIEAGLDPYTTKRLLNHRVNGGDVTSLYVQPSKTHLLKKMEIVGKYLEDKSGSM